MKTRRHNKVRSKHSRRSKSSRRTKVSKKDKRTRRSRRTSMSKKVKRYKNKRRTILGGVHSNSAKLKSILIPYINEVRMRDQRKDLDNSIRKKKEAINMWNMAESKALRARENLYDTMFANYPHEELESMVNDENLKAQEAKKNLDLMQDDVKKASNKFGDDYKKSFEIKEEYFPKGGTKKRRKKRSYRKRHKN